MSDDEITALRARIAELEASIADEREDAAQAALMYAARLGYVACASTRHVSLGDKVEKELRNIDPANFRSKP